MPSGKKMSPAKCRKDQVLNPETRRCVLRNGVVGRKLLGSPSREYHCPVPGCMYSSTTKKGLISHMKTHNRKGRYDD
jgi:hypothetical protein